VSEKKPDHSYIQVEGKLFKAVQSAKYFRDSKTFVDSVSKNDPIRILKEYYETKDGEEFNLESFVEENFNIPREDDPEAYVPEAVRMEDYIQELWKHLTRPSHQKIPETSTLIPLDHAYVVPGGRFREIYYWDSYFTIEGLAACGEIEVIRGMVKDFASLIERLGFIPNGNRIYYLTRSHPPLFFMMLEVLEREEGFTAIEEHIPLLEEEYDFWMSGSDQIDPGESHRRVMKPENTAFNRYWDDADNPRPESYTEDIELASHFDEEAHPYIYRSIRAGAESGWDFSSRWFDDPHDMKTIRTTDILPVDLNSIIYRMERKLAEWTEGEKSKKYREAAKRRKENFDRYFWNEEEEYYFDYNWQEEEQTDTWSLAGVTPLFFELASDEQAEKVVEKIDEKFLKDGGLVTTLTHSGEQWDKPNGWAPLHWFAINGMLNYGHRGMAQKISERWIDTNRKAFKSTGQMKEKYNMENPNSAAEDGEYIVQNGFGWTNGVAIALIKNYLFNGNSGKLDTDPLKEKDE
jgi:alpha,alpha-trehalase